VGTVYRHFPSLDELVPACGELVRQVVALPDPDGVSALFDGVDAPRSASTVWCERRSRSTSAARPSCTRSATSPRSTRASPRPARSSRGRSPALVDAAVGPSAITLADRALVRAMIDLSTWRALRDQGLGPAEAVDAVSQMLAARVADSA
jgi:hypothetical protein